MIQADVLSAIRDLDRFKFDRSGLYVFVLSHDLSQKVCNYYHRTLASELWRQAMCRPFGFNFPLPGMRQWHLRLVDLTCQMSGA
jgi:hypothetical protein